MTLPRGPLTPEEAERHRKRDSLPVLPAGYGRMVELLGEARTVRFAKVYGGEKVSVPSNPGPDHPMVRAVGRSGVSLLRQEYGADKVKWPGATDYLTMMEARDLRAKGLTIRAIARRLRRERTSIERYVRGVPAPKVERAEVVVELPALPLFPWLKDRRRRTT